MAKLDTLLGLLFVFYCVEVGLFLAAVPWSSIWDRLLVQATNETIRTVIASPVVRCAITGFGLVHIILAIHDIVVWLSGNEVKGTGSV